MGSCLRFQIQHGTVIIRSIFANVQFVSFKYDLCFILIITVLYLTHLFLDKMAAISQMIFSDAFSWMKRFVFWSNFHWIFFLMVQLTIPIISLDNGLAPKRQQAIIWTNADPFNCDTRGRWVNMVLYWTVLYSHLTVSFKRHTICLTSHWGLGTVFVCGMLRHQYVYRIC